MCIIRRIIFVLLPAYRHAIDYESIAYLRGIRCGYVVNKIAIVMYLNTRVSSDKNRLNYSNTKMFEDGLDRNT